MRTLLTGILASVVDVAAATVASPHAADLRATFIGNTAVHVTDGRVAILVDFPYQSGAFGYMEWSKAIVPAGPVSLCLFTHSHDDHFTPRLVRDYCGAVLGPQDVVAASGVRALKVAKEGVTWEGLSIRPMPTRHAQVEHYSFLVEWGGRRLYFTGDTDDPAALLAAHGLDLAFVSPWLLNTVESQGGRIDARQVVVYHHKAGEAVPDIQGRVLPKPGDVVGLGPGPSPARIVRAGPEDMPKPVELDAFEKGLREAADNVQTPLGRAYFEGPFSQQFNPTFAPALSECMQQTAEAGAPSFDLVLELGADGRVEKATVRPETKLTTCFMKLVAKDTFPPPPSEGFRVPISMKFTKP